MDASSDDVVDLFEQFDELYMTKPQNPQETEPTVDDPWSLRISTPQARRADPLLQETPMGENRQAFMFDDILPPSKWRDRFMAMASWLTTDMQYHIIDVVIRRFIAKLEGRLKEWYLSLGEYRQLQTQNSTTTEILLQFLYAEFVGFPNHYQETDREEFLLTKCCFFLKGYREALWPYV